MKNKWLQGNETGVQMDLEHASVGVCWAHWWHRSRHCHRAGAVSLPAPLPCSQSAAAPCRQLYVSDHAGTCSVPSQQHLHLHADNSFTHTLCTHWLSVSCHCRQWILITHNCKELKMRGLWVAHKLHNFPLTDGPRKQERITSKQY